MAAKNELFSSTHLKSGPQVLTIASIETPKRKTREASAATISFRESPRRIALTRKRASLLVEMFGENTNAAIGKRIELFRGRGRFKGVVTPFVAVRSPIKSK